LMRQHLAAVKAAVEVSGATVEGMEIGSTWLRFEPGSIRRGQYECAVGTAGSTVLVIQTVLLPMISVGGGSRLGVEGGTHNSMAPSGDYLVRSYHPQLARMGSAASISIVRRGFFPAGGGRIEVSLPEMEWRAVGGYELVERGAMKSRRAIAIVSNLAGHIGFRELKAVQQRLHFSDDEIRMDAASGGSGPGNVLYVEYEYENVTEIFTGYGAHGIPAERLAAKVCQEVERYLKSTAPVGDYLADQLLLPMAISGGGTMRCTALTPHFLSQVQVIQQFMNIQITTEREDRLSWLVTVQ
jgi:RNA 3'-terminal phosphate cyclase (ATP)